MFGAILKATNSSFQKGMTFCRCIYVKKVMVLLAFIFEQPSYVLVAQKNCLIETVLLSTHNICFGCRERSGSVVECLTRDPRAAGSSLTGVTALWSLSKTHLS